MKCSIAASSKGRSIVDRSPNQVDGVAALKIDLEDGSSPPPSWLPLVVVCFLGTRLHSCASLFLKIRNPKSQSTNLAGSLDGAPIITQSRRHKPCSKIEVSYSAHSQLAFDASLLFTDCQRICDCDLRFARCCAVALRCCAAAVRSHNTCYTSSPPTTTPPPPPPPPTSRHGSPPGFTWYPQTTQHT